MSLFLDLHTLWEAAGAHAPPDRLRALFRAAGVETYDDDGYFVRAPRVAIVGVGGLPIRLQAGAPTLLGQPVSVALLRSQIQEMMGFCGFMSYLNPRNRAPEALAQAMLAQGHASTAHAVSVNVLVLGFSVAVEPELCCQRDLVHLSRVTVARTRAQDDPPMVVHEPGALPLLQAARGQLQSALPGTQLGRECRNNLYPASKATMVLLSASLRSFHKLTAARDDAGKEAEFRRLLHGIHDLLHPLAPELFDQ